ncbi:MAG: hypothetical protein EAX90_15485 [Candidatus Heimdallarchaeota archaeon]|nr:hypothetical protein [Candidatus Heimdallarchaeota archaeon]
MSISLKKRISRIKNLSISDSMKLQANLIDDLTQIYYESLRRKYPDASFEELIRLGHKEAHIRKRRREFNE